MGFSIWQLLILLAIIVLLFGTKRLRGIGSDVGSAVKGFKKSMEDDDSKSKEQSAEDAQLTDEDKGEKTDSKESASSDSERK